jgi:hypothetical protein
MSAEQKTGLADALNAEEVNEYQDGKGNSTPG